MHIAEISTATGLSVDTIRFYDKSGMLPSLPRDGRGWRVFPSEAREWLQVLGHLRKTGMPLAEVRQFARSAHGPEADTAPARAARLALLRAHANRLEDRRAEIAAAQAYLDRKIATYTALETADADKT